jgi:hypothetical protein
MYLLRLAYPFYALLLQDRSSSNNTAAAKKTAHKYRAEYRTTCIALEVSPRMLPQWLLFQLHTDS